MHDRHERDMRNNWFTAYLYRIPNFPALDKFVPSRNTEPKVHDPDEGLSAWARYITRLNKEWEK